MAFLLMPFAASMIYVVGALFLKDAGMRGVGVWRITIVTNVIIGVVFSTLWPLGGRLPGPAGYLQPALTALLFVAGQVFGFVALQRGDVSVATPVLGIKVVLVAIFVTLLIGERIGATVWIAAVLSSAGILFLSRGSPAAAGRAAPAIVFGTLAAAAFALFDVLVQKWAPAWGAGRFLPVLMGFVAVYSLLLLGLGRRRLGGIPPGAWRPLLLGGTAIAVQGLLLITSLALYSRATRINVVYSGRGLWSVLAVWAVGPWFGNREREQGAAVFRARLAGAGLLLAAIVLVVLAR
ncbi:MAG TPA: EamA family transporter [Planctomycetota bacterium]|nr:EamA family transporter [Planctomycetota bacterium]